MVEVRQSTDTWIGPHILPSHSLCMPASTQARTHARTHARIHAKLTLDEAEVRQVRVVPLVALELVGVPQPELALKVAPADVHAPVVAHHRRVAPPRDHLWPRGWCGVVWLASQLQSKAETCDPQQPLLDGLN